MEVAPGVHVATSGTWATTSTVVTADDGGCLVVDPALTVPELRSLAAAVRHRGRHVAVGWSTHPHWDHVLWCRELGPAPRWATAAAASAAARSRRDLAAEADATAPGHEHALTAALRPLPADAGTVPWAGPPAVVVEHSGHCPGHGALVLPGAGVLLAGDMLSDLEIPLLDVAAADPVEDYRRGLDRLEAACARHQVHTVVPGHGRVGGAAELARRFAADRAYLDAVAAGAPPDDRRLRDVRLATEHATQVRALARSGHGRADGTGCGT